MKVFVFDLLAYGKHLDDLKVDNELPYPLTRQHFDAEIATRVTGPAWRGDGSACG